LPNVQISEHEDELNHVEGEQLIKDSKTSSGVSISQASTNMHTLTGSGSQISSIGAAVASTSLNTNTAMGATQRPSVGAVPSSNQMNGQS